MQKRLPLIFFVGSLGMGLACDGGVTLLVELKTDLVPGAEFGSVHVRVATAAEPTAMLSQRELDVAFGRDLTTGRRVAELNGLAPGTYVVTVMLMDVAGSPVMSRDVIVTATATTGVTVLMTRDCLEVRCPAAGGDPALTVCLGGRCIAPQCTPEAPEYCPTPACAAASECGDPVASCAEPACEDGTCFVRTEVAACGIGEYCDPTTGCRPLPLTVRPGDGGPMDAGPADGGPMDAGPADGGPMDAGPADADATVGLPDWAQQAYVKASNTGASDTFGLSISLSADGNTLAIGAPNEASSATGVGGSETNDSSPQAGAVYVFLRSGGAWAQQAYLKASNTDATDIFGRALSLSADGDTLAVGAYIEDSAATGVGGDQNDNTSPQAGAAYVFVRSGATWTQQAYVKASNTGGGDIFGYSLSLSGDGDTLAVSATNEASRATGVGGNESDDSVRRAGAVYVFVRSGTVWAQQAYVKASNTDVEDGFGYSVSLNGAGDTLAVGAFREDSAARGVGGDDTDDTAEAAGAVYVFARSGGAWAQQAYVKASNAETRDAFGVSVSLSGAGDTLAVGAFWEKSAARGVDGDETDNTLEYAGAVYVFVRGAGVWAQEAYLKASNAGSNDFFGVSVSLSVDGAALAVGAVGEASAATGVDGDESDDTANRAGAVYVFVRRAGVWAQEAYLKASNTDSADGFGQSVTSNADGTSLAIGATAEASAATGVGGDESDDTVIGAGAAYVFVRGGG